MKFDKFDKFERGWFVGNFEPSLYKTLENDIAILFLKKGEKGDGHYHNLHVEYNIIVSGTALVDDKKLGVGDIFIYEPGDRSYVEYTEDTILVVVKNPATKGDKIY